MGCHENISYEKFPKQSGAVGMEAEVCFYYNTAQTLRGVIVRDDREAPAITIIRLEDGRHVLGTECQYSYDYGEARRREEAKVL